VRKFASIFDTSHLMRSGFDTHKLSETLNISLRRFSHPSPKFYTKVKKCKIWSKFGLSGDLVPKESDVFES